MESSASIRLSRNSQNNLHTVISVKTDEDEYNKKMNEKKSDNIEDENVYLRFYHVFINGELEELFESITNAKIIRSFYEQGNWCCIFEKI